ncbi:permease prefix domain 1-containing protein [Nocardioides aequoreus]|uniref:permease prefix domain 1-containing protein n=1 Tax=Nocardioides aequoreus TaxID=397278 RepID=UPI0012F6FD7D|nr:permease prefix domain 1-containing protein [Nocardioides aequoreus]
MNPRATPTAPPAPGPDSLTERYVHAVTRRLPEDQRDDVARELRATVADRADSLHDAGATDDEAERAAVTELGDPDRLAADYRGSAQQLIGPALYPAWARMLRILLLVVVPIVVVVVTVVDLLDGADAGSLIGGAVTTALGVGVQLAFWVTLVYALLDRTLSRAEAEQACGGPWSPDDLPPVRTSRGSVGDLAASLAFYALVAGALVWQQLRPPVDGHPLIDPALWSFWIPVLLVALAGEAAYEVWKWRTGWTRRTALLNLVPTTLFALPLAYLAWSERLLDPDAVAAIQQGWPDFDPGVAHLVVLAVCVVVWVWDVVDGFRRAA